MARAKHSYRQGIAGSRPQIPSRLGRCCRSSSVRGQNSVEGVKRKATTRGLRSCALASGGDNSGAVRRARLRAGSTIYCGRDRRVRRRANGRRRVHARSRKGCPWKLQVRNESGGGSQPRVVSGEWPHCAVWGRLVSQVELSYCQTAQNGICAIAEARACRVREIVLRVG